MVVDLQLVNSESDEVPARREIERWISKTFRAINKKALNLTIRVVDKIEATELNNRFRDKNMPTNVLAFPFDPKVGAGVQYLGDIVICFPVVKVESQEQKISIQSHFAHMVVHGTLHLCGYDHQTDSDAEQMEAMEKGVLEGCDLKN